MYVLNSLKSNCHSDHTSDTKLHHKICPVGHKQIWKKRLSYIVKNEKQKPENASSFVYIM